MQQSYSLLSSIIPAHNAIMSFIHSFVFSLLLPPPISSFAFLSSSCLSSFYTLSRFFWPERHWIGYPPAGSSYIVSLAPVYLYFRAINYSHGTRSELWSLWLQTHTPSFSSSAAALLALELGVEIGQIWFLRLPARCAFREFVLGHLVKLFQLFESSLA